MLRFTNFEVTLWERDTLSPLFKIKANTLILVLQNNIFVRDAVSEFDLVVVPNGTVGLLWNASYKLAHT